LLTMSPKYTIKLNFGFNTESPVENINVNYYLGVPTYIDP